MSDVDFDLYNKKTALESNIHALKPILFEEPCSQYILFIYIIFLFNICIFEINLKNFMTPKKKDTAKNKKRRNYGLVRKDSILIHKILHWRATNLNLV